MEDKEHPNVPQEQELDWQPGKSIDLSNVTNIALRGKFESIDYQISDKTKLNTLTIKGKKSIVDVKQQTNPEEAGLVNLRLEGKVKPYQKGPSVVISISSSFEKLPLVHIYEADIHKLTFPRSIQNAGRLAIKVDGNSSLDNVYIK